MSAPFHFYGIWNQFSEGELQVRPALHFAIIWTQFIGKLDVINATIRRCHIFIDTDCGDRLLEIAYRARLFLIVDLYRKQLTKLLCSRYLVFYGFNRVILLRTLGKFTIWHDVDLLGGLDHVLDFSIVTLLCFLLRNSVQILNFHELRHLLKLNLVLPVLRQQLSIVFLNILHPFSLEHFARVFNYFLALFGARSHPRQIDR